MTNWVKLIGMKIENIKNGFVFNLIRALYVCHEMIEKFPFKNEIEDWKLCL